ncbi:MAG: exo-alpha-sialidase [Cyclonatronaceae bacterium]
MNRKQFLKNTLVSAVSFPFLASCNWFSRETQEKENLLSPQSIRHVVVASREGRFLGWPANNGLWSWDSRKEFLVGFSDGEYIYQEGHNIGPDPLSRLARSLDGGHSWTFEEPADYVRTEINPVESPGNLDFTHNGFALRVTSEGYHAASDSTGFFQYSYDRGRTWSVPYRFSGLNSHPELEGFELTARTNYQVIDKDTCLIMMAARNPVLEFYNRLDKAFVARTTDGGKTFEFVSWIVPWSDNFRGVMPSVVQTANGNMVAAVRRRNPGNDEQVCWVDTFFSGDNGTTWQFLSRVGDTGLRNGNPPALHTLADGRLACCYANRSMHKILVRFSSDEGKSWGDEIAIRQDPLDNDIGYPQLVQNHLGELVAIYYLADKDRPVSYIEAAIWDPRPQ